MRSATVVRRHASEAGSWELADRPPHPALAGAVLRYTGYVERSTAPLRRREVAQQVVTIIVNLGPALTVSGPGVAPAPLRSFVAPVSETYGITEFAGVSRGVQVDLSPLAARAILGAPVQELVVDLDDLLGPEAGLLAERLHDAPGWDARFDLLDRAIARRLAIAAPLPPDVAWAWRRLHATGGRLPIGALAGELGCSRRHLAARFHDHVGPSPKAVARILRFRRVVRLLECDDGARLAEIAQACGYYDQAHLNRDFRELAGTSPRAYVGSRLPAGMGVLA